MKKQLVDRIQKMLLNISMNSVGKSFPANILDLCQYFGQKKLKDYATLFSSSSSFC